MLRPRLRPERRHILGASLRNPHVNIFQGTSEDPPYTEIYGKNAASQIGPRTWAHIFCKLAQSKQFYRKNAADQNEPRTRTHSLREPRSRNSLQHFTTDIRGTRKPLHEEIYKEFYGKNAAPRLSLERGHTFCASLRNRKATLIR